MRYTAISQAAAELGSYFDGSFFTGDPLAISIAALPFSAVIDMEDGTLLASDAEGDLEGWQILDAVEQANGD